jgi:hypothetical protein
MEARGLDSDAELAAAWRADQRTGQAFSNLVVARRFVDLSVERQRDYLQLWSTSAFVVRRQFHAAARALIMISAYSLDDLWQAIGYDGPLVERRREA